MALTIEQTLERGVAAQEQGKLQEAERIYRSILQTSPLHPDANHKLGLLAVSVGNNAAALPFFKTALEANPNIEQIWLCYIKALISEKHLSTAKKVLKDAQENGISGENIDVLMSELITENNAPDISYRSPSKQEIISLTQFYQTGSFVDAEKLASFMTKKYPYHQFAWKVLGAILRKRDDVDGALSASQKSVELAPQDAAAHSNLGIIFKELGCLDESEACLRQAVELKPDLAEAHNSLGTTLQELGRSAEAEESLRQAIAFKSDYMEAHNNLGLTLHQSGKYLEAEASYTKAIGLNPNFPQVYNNLGTTLQELGRLEKAEANWRKAISLDPNYADAHFNLGVLLKELRRFSEAETQYRHAISLFPDRFSVAYDHLGLFLQKRKKFKEAEKYYQKYSSLEPIKPSEMISQGDLLFSQGDFENALRIFDSYETITSRARALETLYALGRIEDIYKRIDDRSSVDGENIRISAISAFLTKQRNKNTAHKFCNNPLDFLNISNISSHMQDVELFTIEVINELDNVKTTWELNTTQNGFQARSNIFKNPLGKIKHLKSIIVNELISYYSRYKEDECTYISKWPSETNLSGWHVILKQQGHQTAHIHPNGWLSGVIYLKVVPSLGKKEGAIEFSLNGPNYSDGKIPKRTHQPVLGDIVLFPSSLHHRTLPFSTNMDRICVSFDLLPSLAR